MTELTEKMIVDFKSATALAVYEICNRKCNNIIMAGRSRKIVRPLFEDAWNKIYPTKRLPETIEVNRDGNYLLYMRSYGPFFCNGKKYEVIDRNFKQTRNELLKDIVGVRYSQIKKEDVAILEDHICTGNKYFLLSESLKEIGFQNIHYISLISSNNDNQGGLVCNFSKEAMGYIGHLNNLLNFKQTEIAEKEIKKLRKKIN